jgi:ATP-dependent DNA helicase RecG
MTVFGDLEISTLHELPAGRSIVATHVVPVAEKPAYFQRTWGRIREEVAAGRQVYVVCPRIGEQPASDGVTMDGVAADETGDATSTADDADVAGERRRPPLAVLEVAPMLAEGPLAGLRVDVLHGRMPAEDKEAVMRRFGAGDVDVLVATTVIEVGVDVPNATVMVVVDAERFGVSQLHQLRGRVGRGDAPGLCLLVTDAPAGTPARGRLDAVAATLDGFELARVDLEQRREGDVLGSSQSGRRSSLRWLGVIRDEDLIKAARQEAGALVAADPQLRGHPALAAAVATLIEGERADHLDYLDKA